MDRHELIMDLSKLVIAAAWADGKLCNDEVNALKDLLFHVDEVTGEDWAILTMYMESPVSAEERAVLLERVVGALRSDKDKAFALQTLDKLFHSDGEFTREEKELMDELKGVISGTPTHLFSGFSRAFKSAISKRCDVVASSVLRESDSEDYIKNTIYYDLKRKSEAEGVTIEKSEEELRKVCLATGLLARVAHVDEVIDAEEKQAIQDILAADWGLSKAAAKLLAGLAADRATLGLDEFRLSNGFFECTTIEERREFIATLFRVANASNQTDSDEIEAIRKIATSLKLPHTDFIAAKLTIPREDRGGL